MATTADIKNGAVIIHKNKRMKIIEFQHVKPGKGGAFVRTKLKDIKSGKIVRLHIPIITHDTVMMTSWLPSGIAEFHMAKGECWWLDVSLPHKVVNKSHIDRVHLVVDIFNNDTIKERYFQ